MGFLHVPSATSLLTIRKSPLHVLRRGLGQCGVDLVPAFTLSAVPVPGAQSLWTLSAEDTTATGTPVAWEWMVICDPGHVTVYFDVSSNQDLSGLVISGTCDQDLIYNISLAVSDASGLTCVAVDNFTAPRWTGYPPSAVSSADIASAFSSLTESDSIGSSLGWTGTQWEVSMNDNDFLLGARVTASCRGLQAQGGLSPHFDGVLRGGGVTLFPIQGGFQRQVVYGNKVPNDISPYGTYSFVFADPALSGTPPSTITVTP